MIKNITRKTIIAKNELLLKTIWQHCIGLMFKKTITPHILVFKKERCVSIHTFFVTAPIDLIFVKQNNKVCEIKKNLMPYSIYVPETHAQYIIEAPSGTINKTKTTINDKVSIIHTVHNKSLKKFFVD